jgi:predicted N-acetyltransferase YhbS
MGPVSVEADAREKGLSVDLCAARLRAVQSAGTEGMRGLGDQGTVLVNLRALPRDRGDS